MIALLLAAGLSAPVPAPPAGFDRHQKTCEMAATPTWAPLPKPGAQPAKNPALNDSPLFIPGEYPNDGLWAPVLRMVDGCEVLTPIGARAGEALKTAPTPGDGPPNRR